MSHQTISHFLKLADIQKLEFKNICVGIYSALPSELDLKELEKKMRSFGGRVHFPRIADRAARILEFVEIANDEAGALLKWKTGPYGIQEPHPDLKCIAPDQLN